jgi:ABC-2 type transport system ATP-binding protein
MMKNEPVIAAKNLTRRFGEVLAVSDLDLEVFPGEVFGFLGHNGAGKTTTVRLLNGVLGPTSGSARVLGLSPVDDGPALRRRTGVLTETPSLDDRLTAFENLALFADMYGVPVNQVSSRVEELLALFGLAERGLDKAGGYSRGMKQRLALARALLHDPELIFLDEPTSGLDPVSTRSVHDLITHLSQEKGRTVFLTTHNLAEAQKLCSRVAVLEKGRVIALGTPAELAGQVVKTRSLEIELEPAELDAAASLLHSLNGGTEITRNGSSLLVRGASRQAIPAMLSALVSAGLHVYRVLPEDPSLEDVYFALHAREEKSS